MVHQIHFKMSTRLFAEPNTDFIDVGCPRDLKNHTRKDRISREPYPEALKDSRNRNAGNVFSTGTLFFFKVRFLFCVFYLSAAFRKAPGT